MAEGTYEYECMRAELLGIEKPDYEEFMKKESERKAAVEEDVDIENLKETEQQAESEKRIIGGLEELNSILQRTQGRITRFKASCGSLTNLLKIKVTGKSDPSSSLNNSTSTKAEETKNTKRPATTEDVNEPTEDVNEDDDTMENREQMEEDVRKQKKSDLAKALDTDLSRLDAMIEKAESAQYSMAHQSKQMKKFLK